MRRFIRNEDIDSRAEEIISLYEGKTGVVVSLPVPIEEILMQAYGLYIDWDEIEGMHDLYYLGGLNPEKKTIILNLAQKDLFQSTPGLERSTIGHEAGHWEYDIDKATLGQPALFDDQPNGAYLRAFSKKYGAITAFRDNVRSAGNDQPTTLDSPEQKRVVNRFAASLNMPRYLVKKVIIENDISSWPSLYRIRDMFGVSISALTVRLEQLGYIYLKGKEIHKNKAEAFGQSTLNLG